MCMDKIMADIRDGKCLIYSFGIGKDWSFEDAMASLGCQVRAFDPTVGPRPVDQQHPNIKFEMLGLTHKTGPSLDLRNLNKDRAHP